MPDGRPRRSGAETVGFLPLRRTDRAPHPSSAALQPYRLRPPLPFPDIAVCEPIAGRASGVDRVPQKACHWPVNGTLALRQSASDRAVPQA